MKFRIKNGENSLSLIISVFFAVFMNYYSYKICLKIGVLPVAIGYYALGSNCSVSTSRNYLP